MTDARARAAALLARLRDACVTLDLTPEGKLAYEATRRPITKEDLDAMAELKDELVSILRAEQSLPAWPDDPERVTVASRVGGVPLLTLSTSLGLLGRLRALGWCQAPTLEYCGACGGATVWLDPTGTPLHVRCRVPRRTA